MKTRLFVAAASAAFAMALAASAQAQFSMTFDEWGSSFVNLNGTNTWSYNPGYMMQDPTSGVAGNVLVYDLPYLVGEGDVGYTEPDVSTAVVVSDVFRFINWDNVGHLIFYSDNSDGVDAPADTGLPVNYNPQSVFAETGTEGGQQWCYLTAGDNYYAGLSDGKLVPEPASMAFLGLGALGLLKRRKAAAK